MSNVIASDNLYLIVGGGVTGLSVARYLEKAGRKYKVYDTRKELSIAQPFKALDSSVQYYCGEYEAHILNGVCEIILSPGVSRDDRLIKEALSQGIVVKSDVKLFLEQVSVPVVGITGSNGKSTVTTLVGLVAKAAGLNVAVGGNLGTPALDLLDPDVECYVLELSSFQLESIDDASLAVAANLNLSPDHLDRHGSMVAYFQAKQKVFHGAQRVVYNLGDDLTHPPIVDGVERYGFAIDGRKETREKQYHLNTSMTALMCDNSELLERKEIKLPGLHNLENILATFAIADAMNIAPQTVVRVVKDFKGLPHRCEYVGEFGGVSYINDSKATNVGSTEAAIKGLADGEKNLLLIAGGEGKGADFSSLGNAIANHITAAILIGSDADKIEQAIEGRTSCLRAYDSLEDAVRLAVSLAGRGDIVLFSPACASFDMFANFEERGEVFKGIVTEGAL